jgi:hypothetical protein
MTVDGVMSLLPGAALGHTTTGPSDLAPGRHPMHLMRLDYM